MPTRIILKPTQSLKTQWMIDEMIESDTDNRLGVNIIITHNRNILSAQTMKRIKNFFPDIIEMSSKSSNFSDTYYKITTNQCKNVIVCGNNVQFGNIIRILVYANTHNISVTLYADEIDYYWKRFKIDIIDKYPSLNVIGLTASVNKKMFIDSGGTLNFIHLDIPITENYNKYSDNEINIVYTDDDLPITDNYLKLLDFHTYIPEDNIFIPGGFRNIYHTEIKNGCFLRGLCPITINQFGITMYFRDAIHGVNIKASPECDICEILKNLREKYNIDRPIVIIGYSSPGRGITLQSPTFFFTYAFVIGSGINRCTVYQLVGRLTHNLKNMVVNPCKIFITLKLDKIVREEEFKAINVHKLNQESDAITWSSFKNLKPHGNDVTACFMINKDVKDYLKTRMKNGSKICTYQLKSDNTIRYQDPNNNTRNIDTPIATFISREDFILNNWGFKSLGPNENSAQARVMPVYSDSTVKWIGIYLKDFLK